MSSRVGVGCVGVNWSGKVELLVRLWGSWLSKLSVLTLLAKKAERMSMGLYLW